MIKKVFLLTLTLLTNLATYIASNKTQDNSKYRKTIAIDLDGVLNEYNGKYDENYIPNIKNGAKEFIIKLSKEYNLILVIIYNFTLKIK